MRKYVTCNCGHRNDRTGGRRLCVQCKQPLRKGRAPKHRAILSAGYEPFVKAARDIHGVSDESCCVCGKPRSQERHHDRDHDHVTGLPRGLACAGNQGCNALMPRWLTAARAQAIADYLRRVETFYSEVSP
jgi:hypothetical protein